MDLCRIRQQGWNSDSLIAVRHKKNSIENVGIFNGMTVIGGGSNKVTGSGCESPAEDFFEDECSLSAELEPDAIRLIKL